jgi:hypothetical protein
MGAASLKDRRLAGNHEFFLAPGRRWALQQRSKALKSH